MVLVRYPAETQVAGMHDSNKHIGGGREQKEQGGHRVNLASNDINGAHSRMSKTGTVHDATDGTTQTLANLRPASIGAGANWTVTVFRE